MEEFYRRLRLAPAASTFEEALGLIRRTLNKVEDELTGFPINPDPPLKSAEDRMYPPKLDQIHDVPGSPKVKRLRNRYHNTFVGENGGHRNSVQLRHDRVFQTRSGWKNGERTMNPLEELKREIESKIPGVKAVIDAPRDPRAGGFIDLHLDDHGAVVEWSPREKRFGVSSLPGTGFGGADEAYDDVASTVLRLVEILKEGQHTDPKELLLNDLRDKLGISQEELAKTLNLRQPTLSKMERRRDVLISTLRKIVEGLGGKLEIAARFPRALVQLVQFTEPGRTARKSARRKPSRLKADR